MCSVWWIAPLRVWCPAIKSPQRRRPSTEQFRTSPAPARCALPMKSHIHGYQRVRVSCRRPLPHPHPVAAERLEGRNHRSSTLGHKGTAGSTLHDASHELALAPTHTGEERSPQSVHAGRPQSLRAIGRALVRRKRRSYMVWTGYVGPHAHAALLKPACRWRCVTLLGLCRWRAFAASGEGWRWTERRIFWRPHMCIKCYARLNHAPGCLGAPAQSTRLRDCADGVRRCFILHRPQA